uniref:C1q domain-containing protein n=1 Tax=Phragmatopoma lapidosa TaxID=341668 RepID=A0A0A0R3A8_9ANNE|nr:hypothetical protein [Phragmatopoma lapidosa]
MLKRETTILLLCQLVWISTIYGHIQEPLENENIPILSKRLKALEEKMTSIELETMDEDDGYGNRTATQANAVAFTAALSFSQTVGARTKVVYDSVTYNEGNWYNPLTGVFTVPYTGPYLITVNMMTPIGSRGEVLLINNEIEVASTVASMSDNDYGCGATSIIKYLNTGDNLYIQTYQTTNFYALTLANAFTVIQLDANVFA